MDIYELKAGSPSLSSRQAALKRFFDFSIAMLGLLSFWWLILVAFFAACLDMRGNGFFIQKRVGKDGRIFKVVKIKTMRSDSVITTTVTQSCDPRITSLGRFFRKTKIDEFPQLWNVLLGDMSFVGPRPDVPGYADLLIGEARAVLSIRPGITGPATLKYRDEEEILSRQDDPESYNRDVIYPDKVQVNLQYIRDWSLAGDFRYIVQTVLS